MNLDYSNGFRESAASYMFRKRMQAASNQEEDTPQTVSEAVCDRLVDCLLNGGIDSLTFSTNSPTTVVVNASRNHRDSIRNMVEGYEGMMEVDGVYSTHYTSSTENRFLIR